MAGLRAALPRRLLPHDQAVDRSDVPVDRDLLRRADPRHLVLVHRPDDRAAGARREERGHARGGALLAGLLKILPVFILVLPGLIARALYPDISGDDAYPTLVIRLLPPGLVGFMVAALMAALMSSLAATFNSASTLVTFDVYKVLRPAATEDAARRRRPARDRRHGRAQHAVGAVHQVPELRGLHLPAERAGLHQPADRRGVPGRRVLAARQPLRRDRVARRRRRARRRPLRLRIERGRSALVSGSPC